MAQFIKVNADLKGVMNFDAAGYVNDAITFSGTIATGTTITVINPSSTAFTAGQVVTGPGITAGTTVVSYAAGVLTVTGPTALTPSTALSIMAAATKWTVGETVQPQGPKLDFWTLTVTSNCIDEAMKVVQKRATVHIYKVASATELQVAVYDTAGWTAVTLVSESDGFISAAVAGATFGA